jgi:hypothetical protein
MYIHSVYMGVFDGAHKGAPVNIPSAEAALCRDGHAVGGAKARESSVPGASGPT